MVINGLITQVVREDLPDRRDLPDHKVHKDHKALPEVVVCNTWGCGP